MFGNEVALRFFAQYIESQLGIVYVEANFFQLEHRLKDSAHQLGLGDVEDLYQEARKGIVGQMKSLILDLATNNETSFFRDVSIFKALSGLMYTDVISNGYLSSVRIWSAAASSGQEAYSMAMELHELEKVKPSLPRHQILLSDVSDTILKRAQNGIYSQLEIQRGLTQTQIDQYFDKMENDLFKVKPMLQQGMIFKKLNLLEDWGAIGPFEIIFLRNVLIYQSVDNKKRVIRNILDKLSPGGYLVLGAAESLFGISDKFEQVAFDRAIVYKKKNNF
jgi:chemotaxis protein methyltransferase CheR